MWYFNCLQVSAILMNRAIGYMAHKRLYCSIGLRFIITRSVVAMRCVAISSSAAWALSLSLSFSLLISVQSLWTCFTDNVVGGSPLICCCYPLISDRALSSVDSYCPVWHHVYLKGGYGLLVHCLCVFSGDDVNLSLRRISTESTAVRVCVWDLLSCRYWLV